MHIAHVLTFSAPATPAQDIFNLLPNLNVAELSKSFAVESNDMMLVMYVASLIRSVIALHNLIDNKEARSYHEREKVRQQAGGSGLGVWAGGAALKLSRLGELLLDN